MENKYRVIISTLSASGFFVKDNLGEMFRLVFFIIKKSLKLLFYKIFFSHIIIDEAGQAKEIETLIPIIGLNSSFTRYILAGDPKQLGPVESANCLKKYNLSNYFLIFEKNLLFFFKIKIFYINIRIKTIVFIF